jgi:GDPmannose 4,6-dehydratase
MLHDEFPFIEIVPGDLTDLTSLVSALEQTQPDEFYNLGAISFVAMSFNQAELTANVTGLGVLRALEAIRMVGGAQNNPIRFYQASSSEMFGKVREVPQTELTPFYPRSPYGVAKLYGYWITKNYREAYGLFATNGILFNHESPRRGETFVTRKITRAVARIAKGHQKQLFLGNLDARRDWGYAPEYVVGMWKMLQASKPEDYVIATGTDLSVKDFVRLSFEHAGLNWEKHVRFDEKYLRPTEVDSLVGDAAKAQIELGWKPSVGPEQLAGIMVDHDIATIEGFVPDKPMGSVWEEAIS